MVKIAKRLDMFPEYVHARFAKIVAEVEKKSGRKVKNLGIGSPDILPSALYVKKLQELLEAPDAHLYPGYRGIPEFNKAICGWYARRFDVSIAEDEIMPLLGSKDGIAHLPLAIADPGDEVLVPNPGYPAFVGPALMYGATIVSYDLLAENNFKISIKELEKKITPKTMCIWVNYPSNPTGATISLEELTDIVALAKRHDVLIAYDNAYSEITFDGYVAPSIFQVPGAKDCAVELFSFSKTFSFAGYRMGWIAGNKKVVDVLAKVKSQTDSGMTLPLQRLGAYALNHTDIEWHKKMLATYKERRDIITKKLRTLGLEFKIPKASLYIWAKIPDSAKNSEDFCMKILQEKNVLLTPGSAFGSNGDRYVRASICVNVDDLDEYL